nr:TIGR01777 family oxidoreductase [Paenibacillus shirakamiensis]
MAGGTGFVGTYFEQEFQKLGYEVILISRHPKSVSWDDAQAIRSALEGSEMLINLAGKSVNCRYHEANKKEIMDSRKRTTAILGQAVQACAVPPKLWLNSSTATIYRHAEDRPMTEEQGELGSGFSVEVAKAWEEMFFHYERPETRQVALRIAIVLGPHGGVIEPIRNLVRWGLGGPQGNGNQKFSWIHIADLFEIVRFIQAHEDITGVINCSSPNPITNRELMKQFREVLHVKVGLPSPAWMLEMGALFIGTETELVLKSRWVMPDRLERAGYVFKFPMIQETLRNIL